MTGEGTVVDGAPDLFCVIGNPTFSTWPQVDSTLRPSLVGGREDGVDESRRMSR